MQTTEFMESGIPGMDKVLLGGLPRNQIYAIYGTSGSYLFSSYYMAQSLGSDAFTFVLLRLKLKSSV